MPRSEKHVEVMKSDWDKARQLLDDSGNYSSSVIAPK